MLVMASLLKIIIDRIIGISARPTAVKRRAMIRRKRYAKPNPRRQIRVGDKMPPECDGVGISRGDRGFRRGAVKTAGGDQHAAPCVAPRTLNITGNVQRRAA